MNKKQSHLDIKGVSISYKMAIVLLITTLTSILIIGSIYFFKTQSELSDVVVDHLRKLSKHQVFQIHQAIESNRDRLALISSRTQLRISLLEYAEKDKNDPGTEHLERINKIIFDAKQSIPDFNKLTIADSNGKIVVSTSPQTINTEVAKKYYQKNDSHSYVTTTVESMGSSKNQLVLTQWLFYNGIRVGLLIVYSDLSMFENLMNSQKDVGSSEELLIVYKDEKGKLQSLLPLKGAGSVSQTVNIDPFELSKKERDSLQPLIDYRGQEVLAVTHVLPEINWGFISKVDVEEAMHIVDSQKSFLLISALLSSLVVMIIAFIIGQSITKPVIDIAYVATMISEGDLSRRIQTFTRDEIGVLSIAFNQMADKLIEANKLLEDRVREKTLELTTANANLTKLNSELEIISMEDSLTGIANRRAFDNCINSEWKRAMRTGSPIALILLDVDYFKLYNDKLGHQAGDKCLNRLATVLSTYSRRGSDLVARYGGEEFAILLPNTGREECLSISHKINTAVKEEAILHPSSKVSQVITVSIGVGAVVPGLGFPVEKFIEQVDLALYRAKEAGRDRVVIVDESDYPESMVHQ
ncbi:diguanylate cyclase [Motiliproteus sp. MSK22-1]|uniref:diguanylate cyclase n=1 Tax=Motiliproteus sp. MSK22-1 TaxID=1897630 RepID=UPI0009759E44|nr:diguanylate cyclase [Motiliproteus sp. MSK22-1]OMH26260.1 hypothetical protein BGP75_01115 [Motiliproteus sp. MSK22-1]